MVYKQRETERTFL